jgi:hypothetical protein
MWKKFRRSVLSMAQIKMLAINFVVKSQRSFASSTPGDLSFYSWQ